MLLNCGKDICSCRTFEKLQPYISRSYRTFKTLVYIFFGEFLVEFVSHIPEVANVYVEKLPHIHDFCFLPFLGLPCSLCLLNFPVAVEVCW